MKLIPGHGSAKEMCDFVVKYVTCPGRHRIIPIRKSCQRPECPECYPDWAKKSGGRVSDNLRGVQAASRSPDLSLESDYRTVARNRKKTEQIRHITFSPPPGLIPESIGISGAFDYFLKMRKKGNYLLGGWVMVHPYRIKKDIRGRLIDYMVSGDYRDNIEDEYGGFWRLIQQDVLNLGGLEPYVNWSPHFHVIGFGGLPDTKLFVKKTGWNYFNHGPRDLEIREAEDGHWIDEVKITASYILTHAWIEKGKDSRRVFGICSSRNAAMMKDAITGQPVVRLVKKSFLKCPVCGEYLTFHVGDPGDLFDTEQRVESKIVLHEYRIRGEKRVEGDDCYTSPPVASC